MTSPLLELRGVRRSFDGDRVVALDGVDFSLTAGDFVAVTGPSGSGKSTLLQMLGALDEPDAGGVFFEGRQLSGDAERGRFRSRTIGFVFQAFHLLPTLSAIENVQIPMFELPLRARERRERAAALLAEVGLAGRQHHLPAELSGGERQRVAVARSLANDPRILLADEPTGNLDSVSAARVLDLLRRIHAGRGATLVIVTHDVSVAAHAQRSVSMCDGRIVSEHGR